MTDGLPGVLLVIFMGGVVTTYFWRFLGVVAAERIEQEGELLMWVRAVATAIVSALVASIVLSPNQILASTNLESRVAAIAAGVVCFYLAGRNTGLGVAAAVGALLGLSLTFG